MYIAQHFTCMNKQAHAHIEGVETSNIDKFIINLTFTFLIQKLLRWKFKESYMQYVYGIYGRCVNKLQVRVPSLKLLRFVLFYWFFFGQVSVSLEILVTRYLQCNTCKCCITVHTVIIIQVMF